MIKTLKQILFSIIFLGGFLICQNASAASYTVCDNGNGCTYTTIAAAITALTNGTANTITVKSPYSANERVTVNKAGASDTNRLVIIADAGYTPVTKGFSVTSPYVTVNGFEMTNCGTNVCAVWSADYVSFLNNNIHGSDGSGYPYEIGTDDSNNYRSYGVVQGNKIHAGAASEYQLMHIQLNYGLIDSNEIYDCVLCDGIRFWGHDTVITNNYIHDITMGPGTNHSDNFQTFGDCGAAGCQTMYNYVIEKNLCISTGDDLQPFNLSNDNQPGIHDITIRNNVFVNFGTQGNVGIPNMNIVNNTFIDIGTLNGVAINVLYGGGWDNTNLVIKNNLFVYTYNQPPFYIDSRTTHSHNYVTRRSGSSYYAVSDWLETGGVYGGNPDFVNYTGTDTCGTHNPTTNSCSDFDLRLQFNSPAVNAGADLSAMWSSATDKDGVARPQGAAWDIGAYEYIEATLQVVTPNGGEQWMRGSTQTIHWNSTGMSGNVVIELLQNEALIGQIATLPATQGSTSWTVGSYAGGSVAGGTGFKIRIRNE